MIVIEGKQGKSRVLENILKTFKTDECNHIYMFDAVKVNFNIERLVSYQNLGNDYYLLLGWSQECLDKYVDNGYIVFEYNIPLELKDSFIRMARFWENEPYIHNVVITIQNNDLEEVKVYEV